MGLTFVDATVSEPTGHSRDLRLMVDRGASYSLIPKEIWMDLELEPLETLEFTLADDTHVDRQPLYTHARRPETDGPGPG
jgi:predicted aspartyl protease